MRAIRCSPWSLLVVVILADVAPSPSCGSSSSDGYLQIGASDCACAPGAIQVTLDGRDVGETTCGWANAITVGTRSGRHLVGASSGQGSWPEQGYEVRADRTTRVELGCPSTSD